MKKRFLLAPLLLSLCFISYKTSAQSLNADKNSVMLICENPTSKEIPPGQFVQAYPKWMSTLQSLAKKGIVVQAHYLTNERQGIFVMITGESRSDALNNAVSASYQLSQIFIEATGLQNFNTCTFAEIGNVAILPQ